MPSSGPGASDFRPLALCDRAYAFLSESGLVSEELLLAHVYGGRPPAGIRARLAEPLLGDPRFERRPDGSWTAVGAGAPPITTAKSTLAFTSLALVASGPSPARGRVVQISALHLQGGQIQERFSVTVNPGRRVPRYVVDRLGMSADLLEDLPELATSLPGLDHFLGARPVVAQDARLTWAFLEAEARRADYVLANRVLVDANELATHLLHRARKPTLRLVAAQLGIGTLQVSQPDEEARVLGLVATRLLLLAEEQVGRGLLALTAAQVVGDDHRRAPLQQGLTAEALPDTPGIYVLRDRDERPVYVGKARRLRSRMAAYVHRPLGATRRLEGLVATVASVTSTERATDLEALILEDREIRRLQPRFNTVRQQRTPRFWIRRPPAPPLRSAKHRPAPPRLELSLGPGSAEGEFVGPFRNESLAEHARSLARQVFMLDSMRRQRPEAYPAQLDLAWSFLKLGGGTDTAIALARGGPPAVLRQLLAFDWAAALLPADPRLARYVVLRPSATGFEGFVIEQGILHGWVTARWGVEPALFAAELQAQAEPRTEPQDVDVVLRWFGSQRPPARLVYLPDDPVAATGAIEAAISSFEA